MERFAGRSPAAYVPLGHRPSSSTLLRVLSREAARSAPWPQGAFLVGEDEALRVDAVRDLHRCHRSTSFRTAARIAAHGDHPR